MIYASLMPPNGIAYGSDVTGLPTVQCVEPQWFDAKVAAARTSDAIAVYDLEDVLFPALGYAKTRTRSRLAVGPAVVATLNAEAAKLRKACPTRLIGCYHDPMGQLWQYDDDQSAYVADNKKLAKLRPFDGFDLLCVHVYLDVSDHGMTPDRAYTFTKRRIAASKLYGVRVMMFVCTRWLNDPQARDVSADVLAAMFRAIDEENVDACLWGDWLTTSDAAKATVQTVLAA